MSSGATHCFNIPTTQFNVQCTS